MKELPYFKFTVADWLTGDIIFESLEAQGLFINICAIYWQRNGKLTVEDIKKRYKNQNCLNELIGQFLICEDGNISIKFLDNQLTERSKQSIQNSINGSLGGAGKHEKVSETLPTAKRPLSETLPTISEPLAKPTNKEKKRKEKIILDIEIYRSFAHLSISKIDFEKLRIKYSEIEINKKLDAIENSAGNKKYKSLYLTAKNWLESEYPNRGEIKEADHPYNETQVRHILSYYAQGHGYPDWVDHKYLKFII